jgi:23S rRNA (uracil1939-C5)-methyltransferase
MDYTQQLQQKSETLGELFAAFWDKPVEVTPSPILWHYRNKVDPVFAPKQYDTPPPKGFIRDTVLGFKKRGRWYWPLDIETCLIGPQGLDDLLADVRSWYTQQGLRAWDERTGDGVLRTLLVRDGKRSGQRMVVLITRPNPDFDPSSFVDAVQKRFKADSIHHGIFTRSAEGAFADEMTLLHDQETITDSLHIGDPAHPRILEFRISPFSFFQTNPLATERLYTHIRNWVGECGSTTLYDLYGGAGGIAFSCADLVQQVHSVESFPAASADGEYNAQVNNIKNVNFTNEKVKNYLKSRITLNDFDTDAAVVLDPPREGLHPKALRRIAELQPRNLLYVSCNPKILAREMPQLLETHTLTRLHAVDLFPHTRHVEVLAVFNRK